MNRYLVHVGLFCLTLGLVPAAVGVENTYYTIQLRDQPLGSAVVRSSEVTWNGRHCLRLASTTTLQFAMLGMKRTTTRRSTTLIEPTSGKPIYYKLTQDANGTVTHIECKFTGNQVQTWKWSDGDAKGEPITLSLPATTWILGSNNFAHWNLMTRSLSAAAGDRKKEFRVFLPDTHAVQTFQLVRGEDAAVTIGGKQCACQRWQLQGADIELSVDAKSGRLVRMDVPNQKTSVTLADEKSVQAAAERPAQEVLAQHFVQSDVAFDDYLAVRMLRAEVDVTVIAEGIENDASVLNTYMQEFAGKKDKAHITGTVTIRSHRYQPKAAPPFPATRQDAGDFKSWLKPSPLIESDDAEIVAQAKKLTTGCSDRWQAVGKIATWVHKNIRYTIADSPSARLAFKKRVGDCGPHATLAVAMLRAVGIPAKLVGGLLYAPTFGGSFGQHAWVEVHMGPDGWIALDPTTGETEILSATHMKLFEGMGGVIPKTIHVLDFAPANRKVATYVPAAAKPLPWKLGHDYEYTYATNGKTIGTQTFRIARRAGGEKAGYQLSSKLDLVAGTTHVIAATEMVVQPNALPVSFHRTFEVGGKKVVRHCDFQKDKVKVSISGAATLQRNVAIKPGTYCFDNNLIPSFTLLCSQLDLKENTEVHVRTFHPTTLSVIPLTFKVHELKSITVGGANIEAFRCEVAPLHNTFWITRQRRLVRVTAAGLSIDLKVGNWELGDRN